MGLNSTAVAIQPNVSCTCNCKRSLFQSMEISKYSSCRCRGAAAASRGRVRAAPRAGKFAGGPSAAPGPFAAMRLLGVTVPPSPPCELCSPICCRRGVRGGRAQPLRALRGPPRPPPASPCEVLALPRLGSVVARISPLPPRLSPGGASAAPRLPLLRG